MIQVWGRQIPVRALDATMPLAGVLLVVAAPWPASSTSPSPTLAVLVATCIFAQRPWSLGFAMTICVGVAYAIVLALEDLGPAPVSRWVIVMTAVVSSGAFVHWVRSKVIEFVTEEHQVRRRAERAAVELAAMSRAKTEFLGRMSHELRTPLNAVLGFTSILLDRKAGPLTDLQAEYLGDVSSAGLHLVDLVDDVLDVAHVEAGQSELELAPFAIGPTIDDCVRMVRERAGRARISIATYVAPDVPVIVADGRKIRQALLNVVANAVRFTPPGGRVDISAWADGGALDIAVRDTGVGIAAEDQERMFDRFEQAEGAAAGGTGLGLAIARRFVEQHGGGLTVDSRLGEGATFTLSLPARPPTEPVAAHLLVAARPAAAEANSELYEALTMRGSPANRLMVASLGRTLSLGAAGLALVLAVITPGDLAPRFAIAALAAAALVVMVVLDRMGKASPSGLGVVWGMDLVCLFGTVGHQRGRLLQRQLRRSHPARLRLVDRRRLRPVGRAPPHPRGALRRGRLRHRAGVDGRARLGDRPVDRRRGHLPHQRPHDPGAGRQAAGDDVRRAGGPPDRRGRRGGARRGHGPQGRLRRQHVPRAADPAQRHHRVLRGRRLRYGRAAQRAAAGVPRGRRRRRPPAARAHRRHPRARQARRRPGAALRRGVRRRRPGATGPPPTSRAPRVDRGVDLRVELPAAPALAPVDTLLMEHAVSRLVAKAVQSSRPGGTVTVHVRVAGRRVLVAITDQATAATVDREHIFDSPDEWDERDGSGLTLAVARRIVGLHDGSLAFHPEPGGNTCEISVPVATASLAGAAP